MQHQGAHERLASNQLCTHKGEPALVNNLALRQIVCGIGQPAGLQYRTENFQQALGFNQGCLHKRRVTGGEEQEGSWKKLRNQHATFTKNASICLNILILKGKTKPREAGMEHTYSEDMFPFLIYLGSFSMPLHL